MTSAVLGGALLGTVRHLAADERVDRTLPRAPLRHRVSRQLLLLAVIALLASLNEGTAVQWSALYTSEALDAGAAAGAATFACFSVAMTASRLVGDRLATHIGRPRLLLGSALVSCAGMAVALGSVHRSLPLPASLCSASVRAA